jgi:hypothetical protein
MNQKLLSRLPTDLVHLIYQMYFPWIIEELLRKQPQKNDFIVRTTRSNILITEVNAYFGVLYLFESQTSKFYRKGIPAFPLDLEQAYCSESSDPLRRRAGYVSPYVRNIVNRRNTTFS